MEFFSWPVWGFIGNVAQVVSLFAIVFAIVELIAQRRRSPDVALTVSRQGWANFNGHVSRLYRVTNAGPGGGRIHGYMLGNCKLPDRTAEPLRWSVTPGAEWSIPVDTDDASNAWILIYWSETRDVRTWKFEWFPLGQAADDKWQEALDAVTARGFWKRKARLVTQLPYKFRPRRAATSVGPGGAIRLVVRLPLAKREIADAMRIAVEAEAASYVADVVADVPYDSST